MTQTMIHTPISYEDLLAENQRLLQELENAYLNMEKLVESSDQEKRIAYEELQKKFDALENLYSELSEKENKLIHLEKLSSIGQFITELIHELSSPLTAISLQAQMALLKDVPEHLKPAFNVIVEHAERMSNLLGRFRAMAYKGREDFKIFDLNLSLKECLETIEIIKPKRMRMEVSLCPEKLPVNGDHFQTDQVFLNLAKNAFDAMKNQGQLLKVQTRTVSASFLREPGNLSGIYCQQEQDWQQILDKNSRFALIKFIDEGKGIEPEIRKNLFQPFFTTKERGKGTGLGLSISSDIIMRHNGNIAIHSEPGKGSTFQVLLPLQSD